MGLCEIGYIVGIEYKCDARGVQGYSDTLGCSMRNTEGGT